MRGVWLADLPEGRHDPGLRVKAVARRVRQVLIVGTDAEARSVDGSLPVAVVDPSVEDVKVLGVSRRELGDVLGRAVVGFAGPEPTASHRLVIRADSERILGEQACELVSLNPSHCFMPGSECSAGVARASAMENPDRLAPIPHEPMVRNARICRRQ